MTPLDTALIFLAIGFQGALIVMILVGLFALIALPIWLLAGGLSAVVAIWVGAPQTLPATSPSPIGQPPAVAGGPARPSILLRPAGRSGPAVAPSPA